MFTFAAFPCVLVARLATIVSIMGISKTFRIRASSRGRVEKDTLSSQKSTECNDVVVDDCGGNESRLAPALPVGGIKQGVSGTRKSNRQLGGSGGLIATVGREFHLGKPSKSTPKRTPRALAALRTFIKDSVKEEARPLPNTPRSKRQAARSKQARSTVQCAAAVGPATLRMPINCDQPTYLATEICCSKRKLPAYSLPEPAPPLKGPSSSLPTSMSCPVRRKKRSWQIAQSGIGALTCGAIRTVAPRSEAVSMPAQNVGTWEGTGILPLCGEEGCMAPASYGFLESGRVDFCAKHAVGVGMVDLLDHRWGPDQDYYKDSILICSP